MNTIQEEIRHSFPTGKVYEVGPYAGKEVKSETEITKFYKADNQKKPFCEIAGIGHSELEDSELFQSVGQSDFIRSLPTEVQMEITKKGTIEEVAKNWSNLVFDKRTFFNGQIADLAMFAVRKCFNNTWEKGHDFDPADIDVIIGATNTGPGYPSLADYVKERMKIRSATVCYDIAEACTAGSVGLMNAYNWIKSGACKRVLVVCAEKATDLAAPNNWQASNLFGDASFAMLVQASEDPLAESFEFFAFNCFPNDGNLDMVKKTDVGFVQQGKKVHLFVLTKVLESIKDSLIKSGVELKDIQHMVFHQPSSKTVASLQDYLLKSLPEFEGIFHKSEGVGNASSASFGHLLAERYKQGVIKPNELVLTCTFGSGLSVAVACFKLNE